jgi:hypothetical protein
MLRAGLAKYSVHSAHMSQEDTDEHGYEKGMNTDM